MASRGLRILVIFDMGRAPPADHDYSEFLRQPEWEAEADIARVLKKLGHEVRLFGIHNDIDPFFDEIRRERPDLVFNLCEAFQGNRDFEANIVSLLELYGIKYTGAGSFALQLCKDKGLTKKILSYHRVRIPHFIVSRRSHPETGKLPTVPVARITMCSAFVYLKLNWVSPWFKLTAVTG